MTRKCMRLTVPHPFHVMLAFSDDSEHCVMTNGAPGPTLLPPWLTHPPTHPPTFVSCWPLRRYLFLTGYRQELRLVMTEGFMSTWVQKGADIVVQYGAMEEHLGIPCSVQSTLNLKK